MSLRLKENEIARANTQEWKWWSEAAAAQAGLSRGQGAGHMKGRTHLGALLSVSQ